MQEPCDPSGPETERADTSGSAGNCGCTRRGIVEPEPSFVPARDGAPAALVPEWRRVPAAARDATSQRLGPTMPLHGGARLGATGRRDAAAGTAAAGHVPDHTGFDMPGVGPHPVHCARDPVGFCARLRQRVPNGVAYLGVSSTKRSPESRVFTGSDPVTSSDVSSSHWSLTPRGDRASGSPAGL
jgi:hypothetical protein